MAQNDTAHCKLIEKRERIGRSRIDSDRIREHDIPIGNTIFALESIYIGAIEYQPINIDFIFYKVIKRIYHHDSLFERDQGIGTLPCRVAYGLGDQCPVGKFKPEAGEGREERKLDALHVELRPQIIVGHMEDNRRYLLRCKYKVYGYGNRQQQHCK